MRISDCSSDVSSSDLSQPPEPSASRSARRSRTAAHGRCRRVPPRLEHPQPPWLDRAHRLLPALSLLDTGALLGLSGAMPRERKRDVSGKSWSGGVDHGWRSAIKNKQLIKYKSE